MFERFTDRARRVIVTAQQEARSLDHRRIGTEHILLGLLEVRDGTAAQALHTLGVTPADARTHIVEILPEGKKPALGHIPFSPRAKKVLELSLREAFQLGDPSIGTEHILLGLVREGGGVAARVLVELGAGLAAIRDEVVRRRAKASPAAGEPRIEFHPGGHRAARAVEPVVLAGTLPEWTAPQLRRVIALGPDHTTELPGGTRLTLISLELWSDTMELRYTVTPPDAPTEQPPAPLEGWTLRDDRGRVYRQTGTASIRGPRLTVAANRYAPAAPDNARHLVFASSGDVSRLEIPLR